MIFFKAAFLSGILSECFQQTTKVSLWQRVSHHHPQQQKTLVPIFSWQKYLIFDLDHVAVNAIIKMSSAKMSASNLGPDQARQNVVQKLDPTYLTVLYS